MIYPTLDNFDDIQAKFQTKRGFYPLKIKENGYLGTPNINGNFIIWIKPLPGDMIIQVEAGKSVFVKADEATKEVKRTGQQDQNLIGWYRLVFPTTYTLNGIICTKFALQNDFRILRITDDVLEMSQIAVVSQQGKFYLFITPQYKGKMMTGKNGIYTKNCPNLDPDNWKQLQEILSRHQEVESKKLEIFDGHEARPDKYQPDAGVIKCSVSERLIGKIRWYNPSLHFGLVEVYLLSADKKTCRYIVNARIHEHLLAGSDYPRVLCPGDLLEVIGLTEHVAKTRVFKTKFKYDIVDCAILKRGSIYTSSFC